MIKPANFALLGRFTQDLIKLTYKKFSNAKRKGVETEVIISNPKILLARLMTPYLY